MKEQPLAITDVSRILLGDLPWTFIFEAVLRIVFVYILLLAAMRLMGRRMASQLSRNELAALVSLAAATGSVIQSPEHGLLPAVVITAIVLGAQRYVAARAFADPRIEHATQGNLSILVRDGELELDVMRRCQLSQEQVFAHLRHAGFTNLAKVKRFYLEAGGGFSHLRSSGDGPGLSIVPACDPDFRAEQPVCGDDAACERCGHVAGREASQGECPRCHCRRWTPAHRG
jgi:hypothetical protein